MASPRAGALTDSGLAPGTPEPRSSGAREIRDAGEIGGEIREIGGEIREIGEIGPPRTPMAGGNSAEDAAAGSPGSMSRAETPIRRTNSMSRAQTPIRRANTMSRAQTPKTPEGLLEEVSPYPHPHPHPNPSPNRNRNRNPNALPHQAAASRRSKREAASKKEWPG